MTSIHGLAWLGASATYELWPIERLGVGVSLGALGLVPQTVTEGRVTGVAGIGRFDLTGRLVDDDCCRFDVQGFARGTVLSVRGRPSPGRRRAGAARAKVAPLSHSCTTPSWRWRRRPPVCPIGPTSSSVSGARRNNTPVRRNTLSVVVRMLAVP